MQLRLCAETDDLAGRGGRAPFEGEDAAATAMLSRLAPGSGVAEAERRAWPALTLAFTFTPSPTPTPTPTPTPAP